MENKDENKKYSAADPVGIYVYKEVFGEWEEGPLIGLREFTINHLFANIWSRSSEKQTTEEKRSISLKERSMITVALLAAQGRNEELKDHTKAAQHLKITKEQLLEVMIHVAHYAGWPAGHFGQKIVLEIFDNNKIEGDLKDLNQKIG
jgi:alkylhydroperoxidase/carboxymuconolactone decarboxylase family protein YurZ